MRTLLSQFCEEFESTVRPLLEPLNRCSKTLSACSQTLPARAVLPQLLDLRHQLQTLVEKVAQQQAYVLIFGPLKSGKSTLMNAMSAAYVSEVTCLPAYPCMVYVSHAQTRTYQLESYNGDKKVFSDPSAMRDAVLDAHTDLAQRLRERENQGSDFDPAVNWPQAIRRVDVKVPAGALEKSGAVLVDTPGLYSRMKFGYDRMTREFRNAAASAIFVVKTDNLFLEQVFEEFNKLLQLFSRIFLVVNLDSNKKDLRPDGSLVPSLEGEAPERVIEAFQDLSMNGPLKAAAEEGRLKIYPVDLLQAASQRIRSGKDADSGEPDVRTRCFDDFLEDLTDYLNSTDYLVAFLGDSLRRAGTLFSELTDLCSHDSIRELENKRQELNADFTLAQTQSEILARLKLHDWSGSLQGVQSDMLDSSQERISAVRKRTEEALHAAIDKWFENDESLHTLVEESLKGEIGVCYNDLGDTIRDALRDRVRLGSAGMLMPDKLTRDLEASGIALDRIGRDAVAGIQTADVAGSGETPLHNEDIQVRKGFWDWILFRGQSSVRKRLFGPVDRPTKLIPSAVKSKRLGSDAKQSMSAKVDEFLDRTFSYDVNRVLERIFASYSGTVRDALEKSIEEKTDSNELRLVDIERLLKETERVLAELEGLTTEAARVAEGIIHLQARYGETEPEKLIQPVRTEPKSPVAEEQPDPVASVEEAETD